MLKELVLIGGIALLASVGPVFAKESASRAKESSYMPARSSPGGYISLSASIGNDQGLADKAKAVTSSRIEVEYNLGFKLKLGSRVLRYLALEVELEYLPGVKAVIEGVTAYNTDIFTGTANLKLYPLNGRIQPYLLIGAGFMNVWLEDSSGSGLSASGPGPAFRAGLGLDLYMTDHLALALDVSYVLPTQQISDLDYLSIGIGIQYKF